MNIAIFGLGYVGIVSAACLARDGHQVIGVDINAEKVERIRAGLAPIIEPGLEVLVAKGISEGTLVATLDAAEALRDADLAIICVGTPSNENGSLTLGYVERVCQQIGKILPSLDQRLDVVIRSTMLPGSSGHLIAILEGESGKRVGEAFGFIVNPEFLREGSAIRDFDDPPFTVIGESDQQGGDRVSELYSALDAQVFRVPLGVAEMVKYASNAFHALKVVFANEVGNICQAYDVDSHEVMDIFIHDDKLNLSPYYLKPGFSFGGSCLGKDLRALLYSAKKKDISVPMLGTILPSNQAQTEKAVELVLRSPGRKVGVFGLSFKANTDDLRESPAVEMVERLIGKGMEVEIIDREVSLSQLHGSNREYIERVLPHISILLRDSFEEVMKNSEIIIIAKSLRDNEQEHLIANLRSDQVVVDLIRLPQHVLDSIPGEYHGIAW
jgi:GDP-mannose 6-dehydrogenase